MSRLPTRHQVPRTGKNLINTCSSPRFGLQLLNWKAFTSKNEALIAWMRKKTTTNCLIKRVTITQTEFYMRKELKKRRESIISHFSHWLLYYFCLFLLIQHSFLSSTPPPPPKKKKKKKKNLFSLTPLSPPTTTIRIASLLPKTFEIRCLLCNHRTYILFCSKWDSNRLKR